MHIERHVAPNTDWNVKVDDFVLKMGTGSGASDISGDMQGQAALGTLKDDESVKVRPPRMWLMR